MKKAVLDRMGFYPDVISSEPSGWGWSRWLQETILLMPRVCKLLDRLGTARFFHNIGFDQGPQVGCCVRASYLDDAIIHIGGWAEHMPQVATVLESLQQAGPPANPKKCAVGQGEVRYLGYHLVGGQVRPRQKKR